MGRFFSRKDMAIVRHDAEVLNSQEKRGELQRTNTRHIFVCGCGAVGCFLHTSYESIVVPFEKREPIALYATSNVERDAFALRYRDEYTAFQTGSRPGVRLN